MIEKWHVLLSAAALILTILISTFSFIKTNAIDDYRINVLEAQINRNYQLFSSQLTEFSKEIRRLDIEIQRCHTMNP